MRRVHLNVKKNLVPTSPARSRASKSTNRSFCRLQRWGDPTSATAATERSLGRRLDCSRFFKGSGTFCHGPFGDDFKLPRRARSRGLACARGAGDSRVQHGLRAAQRDEQIRLLRPVLVARV